MPGLFLLMSKGAPVQSPVWRLYVRISILTLAIIVLGLSAWAIYLFDNNGGIDTSASSSFGFRKRVDFPISLSGGISNPPQKEPPSLMIYVCIQTLIVIGGAFAVELFAPYLFFRIAVFVGYGLTVIMVLAGWAYMVSSAKIWGDMKLPSGSTMGIPSVPVLVSVFQILQRKSIP